MRFCRGAFLLSAACSLAAQQPQSSPAPGLQVAITRVELAEISSQAVEIDIFVEAESERSTSIRSLSFHGLTANGMPAYIAPLLVPVSVEAGARTLLGPFRATFYFRDLSSLDPLRRLVQEARVRFQGASRAEVDLAWIEQIALWSRRGVVWHNVDAALALEIPGGRFREITSGALFTVAEPVMKAGAALRRAHESWMTGAWDEAAGRMAAVRSSYSIQPAEGPPMRVEMVATGVFVGPQKVLAPREALEPWRYDAATAFAVSRGALIVTPGAEIEVLVPGQSLRVARRSLRLEAKDCEKARVLIRDAANKTRKVKVCQPEGASALAILEIPSAEGRVMQPWRQVKPAPGAVSEAAVFRLIRSPAENGRWWEVIRVQCRREGDTIRLEQPVDRSALGAPLLVDGALVAVVQHEYGGAILR
jgi:hypothetical protein